MVSHEPSQPFVKIPLKTCHGTTIEHSLVNIQLAIEWPDRGDDPNLLMYIRNKAPPLPCFQPSQSTIPNEINTVNHTHQEPDFFNSTFQQQQYFYPQRPPSTINYHSLSNSNTTPTTLNTDHNDSSSMTAREIFNYIPSQQITTTSVKTRENNPVTHRFSKPQHRLISNQQNALNQYLIQPSVSNLNDAKLTAQISINNSMPSNSIAPVVRSTSTVHYHQQSSSSVLNPQKRSVICFCSNPPTSHQHNCPALRLRAPETTNKTKFNDVIYQSNQNQPMSHRNSFSSEMNSMDSISSFPMDDILNASTSSQFLNTNPAMPPENFQTVFTQQQPLTSITLPSFNTNNNIQQQTVNFSKVIINSSTNLQTKPSKPKSTMTQQNTNSHQRKKCSMKRSLLTSQDRNDLNQQSQNIIKLPDPLKESSVNTHQIASNSLPEQLQSTFSFPDDAQTTVPISSNDASHKANNDSTVANDQDASSLNSMVRSPVRLDVPLPKYLSTTAVSPEDIEKVIDEVSRGEGKIKCDNTPSSNGPKRQKKQSLSSQLRWEQNGPTTLKFSSSPLNDEQRQRQQSIHDSSISTLSHANDIILTPPKTNSPAADHTNPNEPSPQQKTIDDSKVRNYSKTVEQVNQLPTSTSSLNISQCTAMSSSPHNASSTATTSPVTPQSDIFNTLMSWPHGSIASSSSPESLPTLATTTTTIASVESLLTNSFQVISFDHNDQELLNEFYHQDQNQETNSNKYSIELDLDMYLTPTQENFIPSTPRPLLSCMTSVSPTNHVATSSSSEKTSSAKNSDEVYQEFFGSCVSLSSLITSENQVIQSSFQHENVLQQPMSSQTDTPVYSNLQSQVR